MTASSSTPTPAPALTNRRHALLELLTSEHAYANDLALLRDVYMRLASGYPPLFGFSYAELPVSVKLLATLDRVPSCKFVFLFHQLSARMSQSSTELPKNQQNLPRLAHPASSQTDLGGAASAIFDRLLSDPKHTARVQSIEQIQSLQTAFTSNNTLKRLFLSSTNMTSQGAITLAEFLP
ncbi:hypothetical protein F4604DRAFT_1933941 [Suillus subluteus]|nr:hypothetical protein F4604DRAFT_1933941 [Suillus subluteus]